MVVVSGTVNRDRYQWPLLESNGITMARLDCKLVTDLAGLIICVLVDASACVKWTYMKNLGVREEVSGS